MPGHAQRPQELGRRLVAQSLDRPSPDLDRLDLLVPAFQDSRQAVATAVTATILVSDLVGSTALRAELGEERAEEVRRRHDLALIEAAERAGGRSSRAWATARSTPPT